MKKIAICMIVLILSLSVLPCYASNAGEIQLPPISLDSSETLGGTDLGEDLLDQDAPTDTTDDAQTEAATVVDVLVDEQGNITLVMSDGTLMQAGTATPVKPEDKVENKFTFMPEQFAQNLGYMGVGMVGIFIVIGIIVLATVVLNKIFSDKPKKAE